jgi:hypothetical protein
VAVLADALKDALSCDGVAIQRPGAGCKTCESNDKNDAAEHANLFLSSQSERTSLTATPLCRSAQMIG